MSVIGIVLLSTAIADRLTRPLRDVAAAARRLERGETDARATGGDDRESAELAESFNAMADRLERSEMLRRRAASDIAHDLATPATVLESQLQAMLDGVVPTDRSNLEAARSAASALAGLVAELGDLASAEAAPLVARPGPIDVGEAIEAAVQALDGLARERDVRLIVEVPAGIIGWADQGHVARALQNVIGNGVAHTPAGGSVTISASASGATIALRIADTGPGIAPDDVAHVFERFYRADPARTRGAGDGTPKRSRPGTDDRPRAPGRERRIDRSGSHGPRRHDVPDHGAGGGSRRLMSGRQSRWPSATMRTRSGAPPVYVDQASKVVEAPLPRDVPPPSVARVTSITRPRASYWIMTTRTVWTAWDADTVPWTRQRPPTNVDVMPDVDNGCRVRVDATDVTVVRTEANPAGSEPLIRNGARLRPGAKTSVWPVRVVSTVPFASRSFAVTVTGPRALA